MLGQTSIARLKTFIVGRRIDNAPPPHFLRIRSSKAFIIATICIAIFSDMFLYGVIVPVVPFSIEEKAGVPNSEVQRWVSILLAIYGAALLVSSPIAGWYADKSPSRRLPLLAGLVVLVVSTVMLCVAESIALLVVGRLLQGLAAGVVWTVGQALLVDTVGQAQIGEVMGYVSLAMSVGIVISPLLGGVVYDKVGYYGVYYMCFGILALDIILRLIMVEKKIAAQWDDVVRPEADVESAPVAKTEGATESDGDVEAEKEKEKETIKRDAVGPSEIQATASTSTDLANNHVDNVNPAPSKIKSKLPPIITLLASRRLLAALWGAFIQSCLVTSFDSVLPLFVEETFSWTSTGAGLVFIPLVIPGLIAPLSGWLSDRYGPRWFASGGFIASIPIFICLRFVDHNSIQQKVLLCALLTLIGLAMAVLMPPLMAEITYIIEAKEKRNPGQFGPGGAYAQAYGLFVTAFAAGCLVGPLWSGFVRDEAGWDTMVWTLSLLALTGAVPTAIYTGGYIRHKNATTAEERAAGVAKSTKEEKASA